MNESYLGRTSLVAVVFAIVLATTWGNVSANIEEVIDFSRDGVNGVTGMRGPIDLAIGPDDRSVYVVNAVSGALAVFSHDPVGGRLTLLQTIAMGAVDGAGLRIPSSVAASPDAKHVYVADLFGGAIVLFERESSGELAFRVTIRPEQAGVAALQRAFRLAIDPGGSHVYVASRNGANGPADVLAVFERDQESGSLSLVESHSADAGNLAGLANVSRIRFSADGVNVYLVSGSTSTISVFRRDLQTGRLTFVQAVVDGQGGVAGLVNPIDLALSPAGDFAYITAPGSDGVAIFQRAADGVLYFVKLVQDTTAGGAMLDGSYPIALSSNGDEVYVGASVSARIAIFARDAGSGDLTFSRSLGGPDVGSHLALVNAFAVPTQGDYLLSTAATSNEVTVWGAPAIDVMTEILADTTQVTTGESVQLVGRVTNGGTLPARAVDIRLELPAGFQVDSVTSSGVFEQSAGAVAGVTPVLDPGQVIEVKVAGAFSVEGSHTVSIAARASAADSNPSNNVSSVGVAVTAPLAAPELVDDSARTTPGTAVDIAVLDNDAQAADLVLVSDGFAAVSLNGAALQIIDDRIVRYTPAAGFAGRDSFSYQARNGVGGIATARVDVLVNSDPEAVDDVVETVQNIGVDILPLFNDVQADAGDDIRLVLPSGPTGSERGGSVTPSNREGGESVLHYEPAAGFVGADQFTYTISDRYGAESTATVQVTVTGVSAQADEGGAPSTPGVGAAAQSSGGGAIDLVWLLWVGVWRSASAVWRRRGFRIRAQLFSRGNIWLRR